MRKATKQSAHAQPRSRRVAPLGILLGAILVVSGILMLIKPPEMVAHHPVSIRGQATSELVTGRRARLYASVAVALGVVLVGVSAIKLDK